MKIGMTLVELDHDSGKNDVQDLVKRAMKVTPPGRQLCVIFPMPGDWQRSFPFEAIATSTVLGTPLSRTSEREWAFTGNISVRICSPSVRRRRVVREMGIVAFRRSGEKAYSRRTLINKRDLKTAVIPALHPVFTRDVANNVWHIPAKGYVGRIRNRLQSLFTWPDERTVLVGRKGNRFLPWDALNLDNDLVGVPQKHAYVFSKAEPC